MDGRKDHWKSVVLTRSDVQGGPADLGVHVQVPPDADHVPQQLVGVSLAEGVVIERERERERKRERM